MKNLMLVCGVFLISVLGCDMNRLNSSGGNNNSISKEQPAKTSDVKAELESAFKKFRNVQSGTVKTIRTGEKTITTIEQYSSVNSSYSRKNDGENTELIIVGSDNFSRPNSAFEWKKETEHKMTAAEGFLSRFDFLAKFISEFDLKAEGEESVDGKIAGVYSMTLSKPHPEVPSLFRIWVAKESGLPLKLFREGKDGNSTESFDYESKVNIERPTVGKK